MAQAETSGAGDEPKVCVTAEFDVPAATLWDVLGDFTNLSWAPPVHHVEFEGEGPGMSRHMHVTPDMPAIVEQLESLDADSRTLVYTVRENNPLPADAYEATMRISETGPASCRLEWSCTFEPKEGVPEEQAVLAVEGFYNLLVPGMKAAVGLDP